MAASVTLKLSLRDTERLADAGVVSSVGSVDGSSDHALALKPSRETVMIA